MTTEYTGTVGRTMVNAGSKSEHLATVLNTDKGEVFSLRLAAARAFNYDAFNTLVGKRVSVAGEVQNSTLFVKNMADVTLLESPPGPKP